MSGSVEFVTVRRAGVDAAGIKPHGHATGSAHAAQPSSARSGHATSGAHGAHGAQPSSPLRARARELLRFMHILRGEPEEDDAALAELCAPCAPAGPGKPHELLLEDLAPSPERFVQLLIYCAASFLASMDWDILVRCADVPYVPRSF